MNYVHLADFQELKFKQEYVLYSVFIPVQPSASIQGYKNKCQYDLISYTRLRSPIPSLLSPILDGRFDYTQNTLHHIISSVAFLRFWRCARLHSGGKDEPVWLGVILRYQLQKLSWRRRQHDVFRSLVFWFNVIFPTTLTFPGNLCCSRYAVVRLLHPVNHKLPLAPRPGVPRG